MTVVVKISDQYGRWPQTQVQKTEVGRRLGPVRTARNSGSAPFGLTSAFADAPARRGHWAFFNPVLGTSGKLAGANSLATAPDGRDGSTMAICP